MILIRRSGSSVFSTPSSTAAQFGQLGDFRRYIHLDRAIQIDPLPPRVYPTEARRMPAWSEHDKAITDFTSALMNTPNDRICCWPARQLRRLGDQTKALATGTKRSRFKPDFAVAMCPGWYPITALGKHEQGFADRTKGDRARPQASGGLVRPRQRLLLTGKITRGHAGFSKRRSG